MTGLEDRDVELAISRALRDLPDPLTKGYLCRPGDPCGHCDLCDPNIPDYGHLPYEDTGYNDEPPNHPEDEPQFICWADFWARDHHDEDWLYEPVLARGRGHALYAGHKEGKSLFTVWLCTQLAQRGDTDIVYLDYEMTEDDLYERLDDMGHGPTSDLDRLHYALLPSLPPLDTGEGAGELLALCDTVQHDDRHLAVIIDTTSRAAQGDENSADTYRDFYRWTGISLKRRGVTWARLDHAGKDALKGQRGSSGKGDDVDIIWRLTQADEGGITLHRDASRMAWVPETIRYARTTNPLGYIAGADLWPAGTAELAKALDALEVPVDISRRKARELMREHGLHGENALVGKALKYLRTTLRTTPTTVLTDQPADQPAENAMTSTDHPADHPGPPVRGDSGPVSVSIDGPLSAPVRNDPQPDPYELVHYCRCGAVATDISGLCPGCQANPRQLPPLNRDELF